MEGLRKSMENLSAIVGALAETPDENLSSTSQKHWDLCHLVLF
jgi:hypothetical protein